MVVKMNIYHCMNPEENPNPQWMRRPKIAMPQQDDLVKQFKESPDSFFPSMIPPARPE
ncbi:hypothetical protein [Anaeromassilibacillus senegalensis]|uniref:hypothetical protein n=1 Tax=Anaeromassilibacillus senegalensis TaxID=1673717 RepID=UPI0018A83DFD|nr:hypothetical protein [Anaeromassilibacillus senegalensis]